MAFRFTRVENFAVSHVVVSGALTSAVRESMLLWVGCVAGALSEDEYRRKLEAAVPSAPEAMTLIVTFKIRGKLTSGADVETNEVRFPIVISREGNPCPAGEIPKQPEGSGRDSSCFNPGQDNQAYTCGTP